MRKVSQFVAAALLVAGGVAAHAQQAPKLATQDYVDIQQLASRYAFLIDTCTNGGNDFGDLFTPDGEFSVSQAWGAAGSRPRVARRWSPPRAATARAAAATRRR